MNINLIPSPKEIHLKSESKIHITEFYLSNEIKEYCQEIQEMFVGVLSLKGRNPINLVINEDLDTEEYYLDIKSDSITITAGEKNGAYYACATLCQLCKLNDNILSELNIKDKPCMKIRGYSDDISRGQISTLDDFRDIVKKISLVKMNVYMPYIEDTFEYKEIKESGKYSDPVKQWEWRELIAFAKKYFVTVVPIINTLGHWDKNSSLEYFNEFLMKDKEGKPLSSLDTRLLKSRELVETMLKESMEVFKSCGIVHAGGDEVGDYTSLFPKEEAAKYYNSHFKFIYDYLTKNNVKMFMYSDMYTPVWGDYSLGIDYIEEMPNEIGFVYWDYACRNQYKNVEELIKREKEFYISPATFTWNRFMPHHYISWLNTKMLTKASDYKSKGLLMSAWCDGGMNLREENWCGIYSGALFSWNNDDNMEFNDFITSYFKIFFGINIDIEKYTKLFSYDLDYTAREYNEQEFGMPIEFWYDEIQGAGQAIYREFFKDATLPSDKKLQDFLRPVEKSINDGYTYFKGLNPKYNKNAYDCLVFDILRTAVCAKKILLIKPTAYKSREEAKLDINKIKGLAEDVYMLIEEYQRLWFNTNRQSEWEYAKSKYLDLYDSIKSLERYCSYGKRLSDIKRV